MEAAPTAALEDLLNLALIQIISKMTRFGLKIQTLTARKDRFTSICTFGEKLLKCLLKASKRNIQKKYTFESRARLVHK